MSFYSVLSGPLSLDVYLVRCDLLSRKTYNFRFIRPYSTFGPPAYNHVNREKESDHHRIRQLVSFLLFSAISLFNLNTNEGYIGFRGSAIARIVGSTVKSDPEKKFDETVVMWVWEETINGEKLSEIINTKHENVKYLPGRILPSNVVRM